MCNTHPGDDARGFGFTGLNGSRWMVATYSFSSPDEGIAGPDSPDTIAYLVGLECGTASQHGAEVEAWTHDAAGRSSQPVRGQPRLPVPKISFCAGQALTVGSRRRRPRNDLGEHHRCP